MNFELNKTQKDIHKAVRDFVKGDFEPVVAEARSIQYH